MQQVGENAGRKKSGPQAKYYKPLIYIARLCAADSIAAHFVTPHYWKSRSTELGKCFAEYVQLQYYQKMRRKHNCYKVHEKVPSRNYCSVKSTQLRSVSSDNLWKETMPCVFSRLKKRSRTTRQPKKEDSYWWKTTDHETPSCAWHRILTSKRTPQSAFQSQSPICAGMTFRCDTLIESKSYYLASIVQACTDTLVSPTALPRIFKIAREPLYP